MSPLHKKRLFAVSVIMLGLMIATICIFYALQQNLNLFFTPSEIVKGEAPKGKKIRIGGMVTAGSVKKTESLQVEFVLTDFQETIKVQYQGILPDLFREGQGVVALGVLTENQIFHAQEILAKHDENYMPPELRKIMKT